MTSEFLKSYWKYRKEGGNLSMGAYAKMVKENLNNSILTCSRVGSEVIKKPFKKVKNMEEKVYCRICGVGRKRGHTTKEAEEKCKKEWKRKYWGRGFLPTKSFWAVRC